MTSVLITGTSSGIGRSTALLLARRPELTVYATARKLGDISDLADAGCRILPLDVNDERSMVNAVNTVSAEQGQVDVLINNAGYGEYGPIEEVDLNRVRAQFETNVFGLSRLTQLVLPGMRRAGRGRIINISSMGGRMVFPGGGYYHASKYAVEAISDALRFEVKPFGIDVSIIEPGLIRTRFGYSAVDALGARPNGPYREFVASMNAMITKSYVNPNYATTPDRVAETIERAVTAKRPHTRYVVTAAARVMIHTRRLLGARAFDAITRAQMR